MRIISPFIYLDDLKVPFWHNKPSLKNTTQFVQKYILKNDKIMNKINNFLLKRKKKNFKTSFRFIINILFY